VRDASGVNVEKTTTGVADQPGGPWCLITRCVNLSTRFVVAKERQNTADFFSEIARTVWIDTGNDVGSERLSARRDRRWATGPAELVAASPGSVSAVSEVADRYTRIADTFSARLASVRADQWDRATPCTDWTVRNLAGHVVTTHRRVVSTVTGEELVDADESDDLGPQWASASRAVSDALADPARSGQEVSGMFGTQSFESLVSRLLCADLLMHTWDLARATGQDEHLDPAGVAAAFEFLAPIDEAIRRPGGFAPRIEPAPGADEQTRLLNFCGRPA